MKVFISHDLVKGRGVFAVQEFSKELIIEKCELIFIKLNDVPDALEAYVYLYNQKLAAIALGNGSLYNHSNKANCRFYFNHRTKLLYIKTKRKIHSGEELTINYGYNTSQKRKFRIS